MPEAYGSRSQYLSLARFCQNLISALFDELDGEPNPALEDQLDDALRSLEHVRNGDLYQFGQSKSAAFSSQEQVRTLVEIWTDAEIAEAIELLRRLRDTHQRQRRADIRKLIRLFSRLRSKALWHFEQIAPTAQHDARRLVPA